MTRFLALAALLAASGAQAQTDRYAATDAELRAAIAASQPGDTVTMANGTWTDTAIDFNRDGAPGDTITVRAETPGEVILTGRSTLSIGGDYLKVDGLRFEGGSLPDGTAVIQFRRSSSDLANHSRLTNTTIIDVNPANVRTEYKWVSVYGRFNRVDHCYFADKTNEGALLVVWLRDPPNDDPPEHRIDHNHFGPRPEFGDNGAETIRIGTSSRSMQDANILVERNLFTDTNGEIEVISNKSGGNVFRGNTFRRVRATLTLRHGNRAVVDGNFFFGEGLSGTGGVRIIGEDHQVVNNYFQDLAGTGYSAAVSMVQGVQNSPLNRYFQVKRPIVANNTFVNTAQTIVVGVGSSSDQSLPPQDITLANNVVQVLLSTRVVRTELEPIGTSTYAGNVVYGQPNTFPATGFTFANPDLAPGADGVYRPSATSPVVGAADPAFAPTLDFEGQPRDTTAPDAGADELSTAPTSGGPLTAADVGPMWRMSVASSTRPDRPASRIARNVPNPFSDSTRVSFVIERASHARLRVFDIAGREVATVLHRDLAAGSHDVTFDGSRLPTGIYLLALEADGAVDYRLVTLAR